VVDVEWRSRLYRLLGAAVLIVIVAQLIVRFVGPLLPSLLVVAALVAIMGNVVRGPRVKK
jgi:hypothetical protein